MTDSIFSKVRNYWKPLAVASAVAFVYSTVLVSLGKNWWTDENYSHGLIVPFLIGYIVWLEFEDLQRAAGKTSVLSGGIIIALAFLMLLAGTLGAELFTQRFSLVVMLAGIVVYFFGAKILRNLIVPFALLLLSIPIPQILFNKIAFPLQLQASQMAVWGIRLFEIPVTRKGNVIELLPQGAAQTVALEVVEACSGIRSLMTLVTLALVLAYFTKEKRERISENYLAFLKDFDFWRTIILMLSAVPIAIVTNAARVSATAILTYYYGKRATEGFWHDISGWLVFIVALVLLFALNRILKRIQNSKFKIQDSEFDVRDSNAGFRILNFEFPSQKTVLFLVTGLVLGGLLINWLSRREELLTAHQPLREIPSQLGNWKQKGTDARFGPATESVLRTSDYLVRDYSLPTGRTANLYVGFYNSQRTGATYHSPQNCLPGAGWEMKNPEFVEIVTPAGKTFTANRYIVQNGDHREVLVYWYQGRGRAVASEYRDKIYTVLDSLWRRRSDGAMVRVMTPVWNNEEESFRAAIDLSAQVSDNLASFVPE